MDDAVWTGYVAECFWADVQEDDLHELDLRIEASVAVAGQPVRYLGRLLVIDDEVVLVMFEGPQDTVLRVAEHARVPFGRVLQAAYAPWPPNPRTAEEAPE
jgi:hypothetical protein